MPDRSHILIVDDHGEIRRSVTQYLERNGFRASSAEDTSAMNDRLNKGDVDLVVLDIMLPGESGLQACARLREENNTVPILILTALGDDEERIKGLDTGADDYLAKPFNPRELVARIRAILRRTLESDRPHGGDMAGKTIRFGEFSFDHDAGLVVGPNGLTASLTTAETNLLSVFLKNPRTVISREDLLAQSAGRTAGPLDRTIDNQISRLRRKIEPDVLRPRIISTVRNGGYCLNCDVEIAG